MELARRLANHVEAQGLGAVYAAETGFTLARHPDTVRAPDVAFVRRERLRDPDTTGFPDLAPDLVVEVLSPGDRAGEIDRKSTRLNSSHTVISYAVFCLKKKKKKKNTIKHHTDQTATPI